MRDRKLNLANKHLRDIWIAELNAKPWPAVFEEPLWPLQYPSMAPRSVLFVGLNPSHKKRDDPLLRIRNPFAKDLADPSRITDILQHQEAALGRRETKRHQYFTKFDGLAGGAVWNHIDVLAVRHRDQGEVKEALGIADDGTFESSFVSQQLEVMLGVVDVLDPPVVVVVNAFASKMLLYRLGDDLDWNEVDGVHFQGTAHARPWLFSGMVTGQRALDDHSFERLRWHLQRVLGLASIAARRKQSDDRVDEAEHKGSSPDNLRQDHRW